MDDIAIFLGLIETHSISLRHNVDHSTYHARRLPQLVQRLPAQRDFDTRAEGELQRALESARANVAEIELALQEFRRKPVERKAA